MFVQKMNRNTFAPPSMTPPPCNSFHILRALYHVPLAYWSDVSVLESLWRREPTRDVDKVFTSRLTNFVPCEIQSLCISGMYVPTSPFVENAVFPFSRLLVLRWKGQKQMRCTASSTIWAPCLACFRLGASFSISWRNSMPQVRSLVIDNVSHT